MTVEIKDKHNNEKPIISSRNVRLSFLSPGGCSDLVLNNISIDVCSGEIVVIIGPSGCGKSSFLRVLAGVIVPTEGEIAYWEDSDLVYPPPVPMVEQTPALLPWRTVRENIRLFSELQGSKMRNIDIDALISRVGLAGFDSHVPENLSGGMNTRVAIARALAVANKLILLDEAFSDLDEVMRLHLVMDFCQHVEAQGLAAIAVNHNIEEAVLMADRIIVLSHRPAEVLCEVNVSIPRPRSIGGENFEHVQKLSATLRHRTMQLWGGLL